MIVISGEQGALLDKNTLSTARPMFAFGGQSNVDGYLYVASDLEAQYKQSYSDCLFYKYSTTNKMAMAPILYSDNTTYQTPNQTARYALQFYLYPQLQSAVGKRSYFVHHAQGGTSLAVDWLSTTIGGLFDDWIFKFNNCKNTITSIDGIAPSAKFVYWGHGETDGTNLTWANNYETNLTDLINNFRARVGLASLPFLIARLNQNIDVGACPYWATVRAAQEAVAGALSNVYIVNQDNATMAVDNIHYANAGYQQIATNAISVAQANNLI